MNRRLTSGSLTTKQDRERDEAKEYGRAPDVHDLGPGCPADADSVHPKHPQQTDPGRGVDPGRDRRRHPGIAPDGQPGIAEADDRDDREQAERAGSIDDTKDQAQGGHMASDHGRIVSVGPARASSRGNEIGYWMAVPRERRDPGVPRRPRGQLLLHRDQPGDQEWLESREVPDRRQSPPGWRISVIAIETATKVSMAATATSGHQGEVQGGRVPADHGILTRPCDRQRLKPYETRRTP